MKLLVLGPTGMLGQAVCEAAEQAGHEVAAGMLTDVCREAMLEHARDNVCPDAVLNCAGIIPIKQKLATSNMLEVNSLAPHRIAEVFSKSFVVQVSTDCVFGGGGGRPHATWERPDPSDLYGKSKLAGELLDHSNAATVRTSFIGPKHGLLRWFMDQPDGSTVPGFSDVLWSGSTHKEVARHLVSIASECVPGLVHLAAPVISKYSLLLILKRAFDKDVTVRSESYPILNRALEGTQFMLPVSECLEDLL